MKSMVARAAAGIFAIGLALGGTTALGQTNVKNPPAKDALPTFAPINRVVTPGKQVDPETGIIFEVGQKVAPTVIPWEGVFPDGTFPQPEREAGRPMRPFLEPWIPDGSGYWPQMIEDESAYNEPRAQPLMQGFESIGPNGLTPPDPDLARGYDYEVAVTNDDFAVYDSCGTELYRRDINDFLGISDFMFDPKVIFDPWAGRWVMMYHVRESNPQKSELVMVISGNSTPFGLPGSSVWWYRFNMVQDGGTSDASWMDYADLGYSNTQVFASGNMFRFNGGFRWARILVFDKAEMYAQVAASYIWWSNLTNDDGSTTTTPRSVKMQSSWSESGNIDAYFINSRGGGGNRITFWKVRGAFGSNTLTKSDTVVGNYTSPPDAVQPTGETLDTLDCRLMTAVATNDTLGSNGIELFTALNTDRSGDCGILLYKFDAVSRALEFESNFGAGGLDYWMASSAADYSGSNFWVFSRTGNSANNEPEIRFVDFNKGTFSSSSSLIRDGDGSYNGFRWGDYFGGQLDWGDYSANISLPGRPAKVWLYAQYGENDSWNTYVGATSVFSQGSISNVTPSGTWSIFGPPGGPFSPSSQVYTISSASGDVGTAFQVESLPSWLDSSRIYGQVHGNTSVTLSVNSAANGLGLGTYSDTVVFDDCGTGQGAFNRLVQLNVTAPDLEVVSVDAGNGTYNPGDSLPIRGSYRNNGNENIRSFTTRFYLSTNTTISDSDILIGTINYGSLNAGDTLNYAHSFPVPCITPGLYYVGAIATVAGDADTSDNVNYDATRIGVELCPGDFNGDCIVNTQDVLAFLNAWNAGRREADCNGDGNINTQDVLCFLNRWNGGC